MLSVWIWVIDIVYIIFNGIRANKCFDIARQMETQGDVYEALGETFRSDGILCVVCIIVSIVFCLAITIAYERSKDNKYAINNIEEYLEKNSRRWVVTKKTDNIDNISKNKSNDTIKENKIEIVVDDDLNNIPKEDECPICFSKIKPKDKRCYNCGEILRE